MNKIVFFSLLFLNSIYSQEKYNDSIKKIIEDDFSKIDNNIIRNLIPFHTDRGVGFINPITNEVVLNPTYSELDFFKPNLKGRYNHNIFFEINGKTKEVSVFSDNSGLMDSDYRPSENETVTKTNNSKKGFILDNESKIESYSNTYSSKPYLFKFKNNYYAIAYKDSKYGIITPNGESLKNLDFGYSELETFYVNEDINVYWFKYKTHNNEQGFINLKGEKKLTNKIISKSNSKKEGYFYFIDKSHPINYYGYSIESNDEMSGVLDLTNMTWLIQPQDKFKIVDLNYSTERDLDSKCNLNDRKKLKLYFFVYENNREIPYYVDKNLRKYLPKNL